MCLQTNGERISQNGGGRSTGMMQAAGSGQTPSRIIMVNIPSNKFEPAWFCCSKASSSARHQFMGKRKLGQCARVVGEGSGSGGR